MDYRVNRSKSLFDTYLLTAFYRHTLKPRKKKCSSIYILFWSKFIPVSVSRLIYMHLFIMYTLPFTLTLIYMYLFIIYTLYMYLSYLYVSIHNVHTAFHSHTLTLIYMYLSIIYTLYMFLSYVHANIHNVHTAFHSHTDTVAKFERQPHWHFFKFWGFDTFKGSHTDTFPNFEKVSVWLPFLKMQH